MSRAEFAAALMIVVMAAAVGRAASAGAVECQVAVFAADVTIPLGHRCMGILPRKSERIVDPLYAHGVVLLGGGEPIVLLAVDWCEIRNGAYDQWRDALAKAAGTSQERVLVASLHQHDAPVTDSGAAEILTAAGLDGELFDVQFQAETIARVATALADSLSLAQPITHIGMGQARVARIASNRRMVAADGSVNFNRGSNSGGDAICRDAPEGEIDPFLKTISFWNEDKPIVAIQNYATHPMSYYGRGEVTSDFVGLARERRQRDDLSVRQIYFTGCGGDVTAGKYNAGTPDDRRALTERLYQAMVAAWENTRRVPLEKIDFRSAAVQFEFHPRPGLSESALQAAVADESLTTEQRILAAMGLSSRRRVAAGQPIDVPCVDFGAAQIVLLPGESFVGFQLTAQQLRPDSFVMAIGYGESWTGYVPTESAFNDGFTNDWLWVAPGSEARLSAALRQVLAGD
ncbi:MAG: hypothetical protein KDA63_16970 [Planctomycetales bacterium]|nr:hypothetical protein [Planctomycetales bacterium]